LVEIKNKYCPAEKRDFRADFLRKAPVIIVICVDKLKSYDREIENGVLAAANLMLAAYSKGLGSVYMSAYRTGEDGISRDVRNSLNIPPGMEPISIVPLGYPTESPEPKVLRRIEEIISYETYYKQ
jgi:nitroreductase